MRRTALLPLLALVVAAGCSEDGTATTTLGTFTTAPSSTAATTTVPETTTTTAATTTTSTSPVPLADLNLALVQVASGLTQPLFVAAPPGDDRLFVVEQDGHIQLLGTDGSRLGVFLDISGRISFGGEQGLLGLAFHPDYLSTGLFYVNYTDRQGATVLAEYRVSADPDVADAESARTLLTVDQPAANHNGGMIAFGPDGYLYIGLGDGGGGGDPYRTGQDPYALLGSILRIDVAGDPYGIPAGNPYAAGGGAPEVWAKGLRNPWRFSFDGDLIYIGDVGQNLWEEIDVAHIESSGLNFGWSVMEGNHCYAAENCEPSSFVLPDLEYGHADGNCSVTGGYVYRGEALPELHGAYFYGDYCTGMIASYRRDLEGPFDLRDWSDALGRVPLLTSFGLDGSGELYLTSADGRVFRIEAD